MESGPCAANARCRRPYVKFVGFLISWRSPTKAGRVQGSNHREGHWYHLSSFTAQIRYNKCYCTPERGKGLTTFKQRDHRRSHLLLPWPYWKITGPGMVTRIDLRVHTTASSSRKDDERFKAQAEAYGSFVVGNTFTRVFHDGSLAPKSVSPASRQFEIIPTNMIPATRSTPEQQIGELKEVAYDPTTFLEETQLGYTALESQLFAPLSRISAEGFKQIVRPLEDSTTEVSKPESEPSGHDDSRHDGSSSSHQVPSQSSYLKSPVLDRSNKKPRINEENRHLFRTRKSVSPSSPPLREHISHPPEGGENADDDRERR